LFMYLIVGLGNPGKQYENTKHNAGFMAVDFLVEKLGLPKFQLKEKFKSEIVTAEYDGKKIILAKPQTYMNNSGSAVQALQNYFKIQPENLIAVYDELDLPWGEIRVRQEGSSAGHNGIKSIIAYVSSDKFNRVRIGIRNKNMERIPAEKFVLSKLSFFEKRKLKKEILPRVMEEVLKLISN